MAVIHTCTGHIVDPVTVCQKKGEKNPCHIIVKKKKICRDFFSLANRRFDENQLKLDSHKFAGRNLYENGAPQTFYP